MSYDIFLKDAKSGERVMLDQPHQFAGGTYAIGGTREAWLNVTYNYSSHFYRVIDEEKGIRKLYGMTAKESMPLLVEAIEKLKQDVDPDYWKNTEGNARKALSDLLLLATVAPADSVWDGD